MEAAFQLAFIFLLITAAISDLLTMKIPNWLSLALGLLFFPAAFLAGLHITAIGLSAVAALCVFVACFALFALNVMGGGDAKLLTASALWFGLGQGLIVFLVNVAFCGGLLTLLILLIRWKSCWATDRGIRLPPSLSTAKKIPYGIAIAAGALLAMPQLVIVA
ncbi:prepilin peptidase [Rhizobium helianthi]|uniref:Prepilin peptidase n=1 Tax=Rhizobium helianthi TaxID=1132695 RepID=A0ABW4M0L1_9HYPH